MAPKTLLTGCAEGPGSMEKFHGFIRKGSFVMSDGRMVMALVAPVNLRGRRWGVSTTGVAATGFRY